MIGSFASELKRDKSESAFPTAMNIGATSITEKTKADPRSMFGTEFMTLLALKSYWRFLASMRKWTATTFLQHIFHVVLMCTQKQMSRIHARRIVTAMKYLHSRWNNSLSQFKRNPMCPSPSTTASPHSAISVSVYCADPQPTIIRLSLFNFRPEADSQWHIKGALPRTELRDTVTRYFTIRFERVVAAFAIYSFWMGTPSLSGTFCRTKDWRFKSPLTNNG